MKEPKTISRVGFECLCWALFGAFVLAETLLSVLIARALRREIGGGLVAGMSVPNAVFSRLAADRLLRLFGRSRSGQTQQIQERSVALHEGHVADDEVVEVYLSRPLCRLMIVTYLGGLLIFSLMLNYGPPNIMMYVVVCGFIGFCAIGEAVFWVLLYKPIARADAGGIRGYPVGFHLAIHGKFVPWSEVATCEIVTYFDTFGTPFRLRPTLRDKYGEELLCVDLLNSVSEDRERLVKYIKAKLPKTRIDPWDAEMGL